MKTRIAVMVCGAVLGSALGAAAQTWDDRFFLNVSVGGNAGSADSAISFSEVVYDEPAEVVLSREVGGAALFDVTAGRPITGNFGLAVSFSSRGSKDSGQVTGSIPDPIFFDRPRSVTFDANDLEHSERWLGFHAAWFIPVGERLDAVLFAGPAVVFVSHDVPTDLSVSENGPTPTVTVAIGSESATFAGFQIGADLRYLLTETVGVGGFARFSGASGTITGDNDLSLKAFQIGAGLRLKF